MYVCGNLQNWSLYPHTLIYSHGTWTQWSLGIGHNDPWVESHMWPQQMWGQRSSRHGWKKCPFSWDLSQNFPPILLNFPPFLYVFLYFRGKISLQMSKFPGNQVPEFPTFSRHASRGQWPLVQVFAKRVSVSTYFDVFSNLILYYNDCKSMWLRKQARLVVREPPCYNHGYRSQFGTLKDYRYHDFPNTEFSYFLTIDTRQ